MAVHGFVFADPHSSEDNFDTFNPQDIFADSKVSANAVPEKIPPPWRTPPVMKLDDVLGAAAIAQIQSAGHLVFHSVGDTGGIKEPAHQFAVADAMAADLRHKTLAKSRPAFFFHLGDIVYYFGQEKYYYDQFYDPYRNYNAPIFAIPGNHDAVVFAGEPVNYSLEPFVNNFCTKSPGKNTVAAGIARTTMTQPGVYFALDAPFARIIGLYSNTSEGATEGMISGSVIGNEQVTFLIDRLKELADERKSGQTRALILATHHPPFTGSSNHVPSPRMLHDIDGACQQTGVWPDLALSGHSHLFERYTRTMKADGRQIPYIVAGNGGYFNLSGFKKGQGGVKPQPGATGTDTKGNALTLEHFDDATFGFLRVTVSAETIKCQFMALQPSGKVNVANTATVTLATHKVS
jgi:hypothetical protein